MNSNVATLAVHKPLEKKETESKNIAILEQIDFIDSSDTINIPLHPYVYPMKDRVEIKEIEFTNDLEFNGYEWAYKKLNLNDSIHSLIAHPEWLTHIVNFNKKGTSVSFLNTSDYSGGCIVVNKGIICSQGYGYPYNSYKRFIVKNDGFFKEVESYTPTSEKLLEKQRFNYILNKIPELKHKDSIRLVPLDEDFFRDNYSNSINLDNKDDVSELIKLFLKKSNKTERLIQLLKKEEISQIWFTFKSTTEKYSLISLNLIYEIDDEFFSQNIFLCYDRLGKLSDLFFTNYEEYNLKSMIYFNKIIYLKKEERENVRFPDTLYQKVIFDEEKGKFKVIDN